MNARLTPAAALLLVVPPLLWASNAVIGRLVRDLVSPATLNFARWALAFALLLPLAADVLRPKSALWTHWRHYTLLGLLGVGLYNALQYLALRTSTPINVTLVAASMPFWMLATGTLFFQQRVRRNQLLGAVLSVLGVMLVLSRGDARELLALRLVPGDLYVMLATISWACYSWLLTRTHEPQAVRGNWSAFLLAQVFFGGLWSGAFAAGEWALGFGQFQLGWTLAVSLLFIALGPALIAYRCWGAGIERAGPVVAGFFLNLTPLFAALLSAAFLGEAPHAYHAAAFALIVGGIVVSARH